MSDEMAYDLSTPSNITTVTEYDPETGCYIVRTRMGDIDIATPFMLSESQYNNWQLRRSMQEYYRKRNLELAESKSKEPFNVLDMNFAIGPLEKIFGPGGVQLKTQGSVLISMGIKSNKTDTLVPYHPLAELAGQSTLVRIEVDGGVSGIDVEGVVHQHMSARLLDVPADGHQVADRLGPVHGG